MWKVVAKTLKGKKKSRVSRTWENALSLVCQADDKGWKVKVERVYVDFFAVGEDGELRRVIERVTPQTATIYALSLAKVDQNQSGCLIWPSGVPLPAGWTVVEAND